MEEIQYDISVDIQNQTCSFINAENNITIVNPLPVADITTDFIEGGIDAIFKRMYDMIIDTIDEDIDNIIYTHTYSNYCMLNNNNTMKPCASVTICLLNNDNIIQKTYNFNLEHYPITCYNSRQLGYLIYMIGAELTYRVPHLLTKKYYRYDKYIHDESDNIYTDTVMILSVDNFLAYLDRILDKIVFNAHQCDMSMIHVNNTGRYEICQDSSRCSDITLTDYITLIKECKFTYRSKYGLSIIALQIFKNGIFNFDLITRSPLYNDQWVQFQIDRVLSYKININDNASIKSVTHKVFNKYKFEFKGGTYGRHKTS